MSKFHFTLDDNGNVANISFPKTNIEAKIEYPEPTEEGEVVTPSSVSINGQSMSVDQFSEIKVEKDESGNINIGGGSTGGDHPWWWDWWNKNHNKINPVINNNDKVIVTDDNNKTTNVSKGVIIS